MKKIILLGAFLIFLISFSSSIKISPTQQRLVSDQFETKCTNIWVLPEEDYLIKSAWTFDGMGNLEDYTLEPKDIGINISHDYISDGKYEICFTPEKSGNISGIIYFYSEENLVEIGSWIDLEVRKVSFGENIQNKINLISGNVIGEGNETNLVLGGIFVSLLVVLTFVLLIKKK